MTSWTFTSESVTEGHPDKMADQISDVDPRRHPRARTRTARVAARRCVTTGLCIVAGEITTSAYVDIPSIVRETINDIGYDRERFGYDGNTCGVMVVHRRAVARHRPGRRRLRGGPLGHLPVRTSSTSRAPATRG